MAGRSLAMAGIELDVIYNIYNIDELVKSLKFVFLVIPADPGSGSRAGTGIQ